MMKVGAYPFYEHGSQADCILFLFFISTSWVILLGAGAEDRATLGSDPSAAPAPDDLPGFFKPGFFFDRLEPCAKSRGFGGSAPKSFSIGSHACVSLSVRSFCGWRFRRSPPSIRADLCCVRHQIPHPPFGGLERTAFKAQPSHPRFFSCRTQGQPVHFSNRFNALASTDFFRSPGFFPALPVQLNSLTPLSASLPPAPGPDPHTATTPPTASAPAPRCLACAPVRRAWRTFRDTTR